jgi:hypothetical protein
LSLCVAKLRAAIAFFKGFLIFAHKKRAVRKAVLVNFLGLCVATPLSQHTL